VWGHSLVCLRGVTPDLTRPVGLTCAQPAPEVSAGSKQDTTLKKHALPPHQRPPPPPPQPSSPTQPALARRLLAPCSAPPPPFRGPGITAEARDGTAAVGEGAAARFGGVQVRSPRRRHPTIGVQQRDQHVADSVATHPGTPPHIRIRGGEAVGALVGRARWSVGSHHPTRCSVALTDAGEETSRSLLASDLTWRTLDLVQGPPLRWLVEGCVPDGQSPAGGSQLTTQPGAEGAHRRVILSLLVAHGLGAHPDPSAPFPHHLPASTVGSLRAHGPIASLVHVIATLVSADAPQAPLHRFTHALREVCAGRRSTKQMIQRPRGRLEPTPALTYRAHAVMRNRPILST
jgi:hypothetical protein